MNNHFVHMKYNHLIFDYVLKFKSIGLCKFMVCVYLIIKLYNLLNWKTFSFNSPDFFEGLLVFFALIIRSPQKLSF